MEIVEMTQQSAVNRDPPPPLSTEPDGDLDNRISAAFRKTATSEEVAALILEADTAALEAGKAAERARSRALDPALNAKLVSEARKEMEDSAFRRERLENAVTRLRERLERLKAREEDARREIAYQQVVAERNKLAAELKEIYPPFEAKLRDIMPRLVANDQEIEALRLPSNRTRPLVAELIARDLPGFTANNGISNVPRITQALRLPAFQYSQFEPYAWPGQR
jgi:membrane-bound lytic murein transglycosylase